MAEMQSPDWDEPIHISDTAWKQEKKASRKRVILISAAAAAALITVAAALVCIYLYKSRPDTSGRFNGIPWGTSCEAVEKKIGAEAFSEEGTKMIVVVEENYEGKEGVRAVIIYSFASERLNTVLVNLYNGSSSPYTDEALLEIYTEQFDEWYGEHEEYTSWGMDTYRWTTEESIISLEYVGFGFVLCYSEK